MSLPTPWKMEGNELDMRKLDVRIEGGGRKGDKHGGKEGWWKRGRDGGRERGTISV